MTDQNQQPGAGAARPSASQDAKPGPGAGPQQPVKISCTRGLAAWLLRHNVSIGFTSYQTGRLYLIGVDPEGRVSFHERFFARAMGLWGEPQRLLLATVFQLWRFENILGPGQQTSDGSDRHYVPRVAHTTGDLDIHDIGVMADGRIVFVNTLYSCLALLSPTHSFRACWMPPFISKLAPEDRCHLNGMAMKEGRPAYVTAVCRSDIVNGWRDRRAEGGCVIDVKTNTVITEKLSMPHSPRLYDDQLWVLNSGTGHLGMIDPASGRFEVRVFCPGFLRGLAFHDGHAIVGLSLPRDGSFSGLALDDELKKCDAEPWCGVQFVELSSGNIVQWIRLEGGVTELFDVCVLPGVRQPTCTGLLTDEIQSLVTFEIERAADDPVSGEAPDQRRRRP
jgi:uncharacterized protein (TIGR03032 family)